MNEKTILLFDDYLEGALSEKDTNALESRLEKDAELQDAFAIFKDLNGHLSHTNSKERANIVATLEEASNSYFNKNKSVKKEVKVIAFKPMRYLVAACVVFLFGTIFWFQMQEASYGDYSFKGRIDLVERSGGEEAFAKAEKAFNDRSYIEAVLSFDTILKTDPDNAQVLYYKGIALVELDRDQEGQNVFEKLSQGNSVFKYKAQWYKGLSLLKQDKTQECKAILKLLPETAEDYDRAQKLLKKLD